MGKSINVTIFVFQTLPLWWHHLPVYRRFYKRERENVEVYMLWMNFQRFFDDFFKDSSFKTENIAEKRKEREKVVHSQKKLEIITYKNNGM